MKKNIAALLVFVMVFAVATPAAADYRTGSAAGDAVAYDAGGAAVSGGAYVAVAWLFGVACPPVAIVSAAVVGGTYLGWYGATDPDKDIVKDVEMVAKTGALGLSTGLGAAVLEDAGGAGAGLQPAY